jgi:hypothetical protein
MGCSREGEGRVKAGAGALEAASIAAPAMAAIAPPDRMRKTMGNLQASEHSAHYAQRL